jgi:hypothetical protein
VSGRLRRLLARPIAERERQRAFVVVAAVLLLGAGALTLIAPPRETPHRSQPRTPASVPAPASTTTTAPPVVAPERPPQTVTRPAWRFLADYLAFVYGHARARTFAAASRSLRRRLASRPPRVSPAMRRRHPHVVRLTGHRLANRSRWVLTATIADGGAARYPIELVIETRPRGRALVVQLGEV